MQAAPRFAGRANSGAAAGCSSPAPATAGVETPAMMPVRLSTAIAASERIGLTGSTSL